MKKLSGKAAEQMARFRASASRLRAKVPKPVEGAAYAFATGVGVYFLLDFAYKSEWVKKQIAAGGIGSFLVPGGLIAAGAAALATGAGGAVGLVAGGGAISLGAFMGISTYMQHREEAKKKADAEEAAKKAATQAQPKASGLNPFQLNAGMLQNLGAAMANRNLLSSGPPGLNTTLRARVYQPGRSTGSSSSRSLRDF